MSLFTLSMLPPPDASPLLWRVEIMSSSANIFSMSESVRTYLDQRGFRRGLTTTDARKMLEIKSEVFYFDAEIAITNLMITRRINDHSEIEVLIPYQRVGGGQLDGVIEQFHRLAGLNDAERTLVPRNQLSVISGVGADAIAVVGIRGESGVGDATIVARRRSSWPGEWHSIVEAAIRLPTGRNDLYFSSGTPNYGVQGSLARQTDAQGFYASASYVRPGASRRLPDASFSSVRGIVAAYEHRLTANTSATVQASWSRSGFRHNVLPDLGKSRDQISLAIRRRHAGSVVSFALTENVANYKNTPDIGVHLGITFNSGGVP